MNYIDISLLAIILLFAVIGYFRGFLMTALHFGSSIIASILSKLFSSPISEFIYSSFLKQTVIDKLYKVMPSGSVNGELQTVIDKSFSGLPDAVTNAADQFGLYPDVSSITSVNNTYTVEYIESDVIGPILQKFISLIVMLALFIIFVLILRIVCHFINKMLTNKKKHKVINKTNKILGGVFGALKGVIPAGFVTIAISLIASFSDNAKFLGAASDSIICSFVSDLLQ